MRGELDESCNLAKRRNGCHEASPPWPVEHRMSRGALTGKLQDRDPRSVASQRAQRGLG
jgi:hypothetical protein